MEQIKNHVQHEFEPVYDEYSQILILGTLPSVKSRENRFYYGHPQNRFWKLLAYLTQAQIPETIEQKKSFLLEHHIAVWDVIAECDIIGSSDSSIRNVIPNDISRILRDAPIRQIYTNGGTAFKLYEKYCLPLTRQKAIRLPSTSPANAAYSLERLILEWSVYLKETLE